MTSERLRVLALGAHPDDIELGCGATIAKLVAQGAAVRALVFTGGAKGKTSDQDRADETIQALKGLGVQHTSVLDFPDTQLGSYVNEMIAAIEEEVGAFGPHRVYTMFDKDRHQDHRAVYEASAVACRPVPQLLAYETPSSYPNFMPTVFTDVQDFMCNKVGAIHMHKSQIHRRYMQEEQVRAAAMFRGCQIGHGPCEGFVPYKMVI